MTAHDARRAQLLEWLRKDLGRSIDRLEPASADASFRRYFRAFSGNQTWVAMDAPPEKENVRPYLEVTRLLESTGVHVPHVLDADETQGFVLLEDLGSTHYLQRLLAGDDPDRLYADALAALIDIQVKGRDAARQLPPYDRAALQRELDLMPEWFCTRHLGLELDDTEREMLASTFEFLVVDALAQPRVFVHRDYHSRNLMVLPERSPGIIDFQDALEGPVAYDLVSILKDCYIAWPRERVEEWVREYRERLLAHGGQGGANDREFLRWFDLIGVQRHVKVLGIFARLNYRDGKPGYLGDLPRTLDYVRDASSRHVELQEFARWLERRIAPRLPDANARAGVRAT
jgi:aminoglycoside/choline kinase family phosphotransferase